MIYMAMTGMKPVLYSIRDRRAKYGFFKTDILKEKLTRKHG